MSGKTCIVAAVVVLFAEAALSCSDADTRHTGYTVGRDGALIRLIRLCGQVVCAPPSQQTTVHQSPDGFTNISHRQQLA